MSIGTDPNQIPVAGMLADSAFIEAKDLPVSIAQQMALDGKQAAGNYEAAITKSTGYVKWTGSAWSFVNETYEPADATILKDADIGVTVQGYDADIPIAAASQAEMEAGTEVGIRSMSPLRVKQAIDALGVSAPAGGERRAWIIFNAATASILASYNVSTLTDNGVGKFRITFTNAMSDGFYCVSAICSSYTESRDDARVTLTPYNLSVQNTGYVDVAISYGGASAFDSPFVVVQVFR